MRRSTDARKWSTTSRVAIQRRSVNRRTEEIQRVVISESDADGSSEEDEEDEEDYSFEKDDNEDDDENVTGIFPDNRLSSFAFYLNKFLLVIPVGTNILIRSIASPDFRAIAIAWSVILPLTSDISVDEGVFPALVATSLNYDNSVVARNMYISIARSRLGLLALALMSVYSKNYHILICGILLRFLLSFSLMILQDSIPKSEATLICGAVVNVLYHLLGNSVANLYDPAALIACGLVAALPCYPLFSRFVRVFRRSRGKNFQWPLAILIYTLYFAVAAYLYFWVYGVNIAQLWGAISENSDLFAYWGAVLFTAFLIARSLGSKLGLDGRRKLWHISCVLMFLPESVRQNPLTKVCLAVAIVLFVALETARATALPPFGIPLHNALQSFIDHRDRRGPVVISHLYLLLGIATPIFLVGSPAGVICLGLGDTAASQVGRRFGRIRVFGHKSFEGCAAFALVSGIALTYFTSSRTVWSIVIPTAILEAVTPLNDNLVVPMYMLALQGLFDKKYK